MKIALEDPRFVPELVEFLGRARVAARAGRSGRVLIEVPGSLRERTRLELIVTAWQSMNPGARMTYLETAPALRRGQKQRSRQGRR